MSRLAFKAMTAMISVTSIPNSLPFYEQLGFAINGSFTPPGDDSPSWVSLRGGALELMLSRASEPVGAAAEATAFYIYCDDVTGTHRHLAEAGLEVSEITHPFFNPNGEFRLTDPDGYVIYITHT